MAELDYPEKEASSGPEYSYVVANATLQCSFGTATSILTAPVSHGYYFKDKAVLNINDYKGVKNIVGFTMCTSRSNPLNVTTPTCACVPNIVAPWIDGKTDVLIENFPALLNKSTCVCAYLGKITVVKDGQE